MMQELFIGGAVLFAVLILVCVIRMLTAKTAPDRMLALDVINILVVISMILLALAFAQPIFIDVAVIYAIISFVGTMYIAKHIAGDLK
jgi:Multisubunit Na+/H+ antiporter, MnhF subunit